jgi:subtilisin-like proprotein convertase family protein
LVILCLLSASGLVVPRAQSAVGVLRSFTNVTTITIADESPAVPYPSVISVTGLTGVITNVSVTLRGLTHSWPDDIDVLLVGPGGQRIMLMSDAGGSFPVNGVTLTFNNSVRQIPNSAQITSGVHGPANWGSSAGDDFPPPAPTGPYIASLEALYGGDPNGTWALYIMDDIPGNDGELANGWSLTISTGPEPPPTLTILKSSPVLQLSWPTNSPGYTLEACLVLPPLPGWTDVTNATIVTNGQYQVVVPADEPRRFFRLRK